MCESEAEHRKSGRNSRVGWSLA